MARGRKPGINVVVPMKEAGESGHNLQERAIARANQLRPEGLNDQVRWVYDRLAPALCHPSKDRLNEVTVFMFVQLCRAIVRYEKLELILEERGESYAPGKGRNGNQRRATPEAAQINVVWGQIRQAANDFGMTPVAERALGAQGQLGFSFGGDDDDFT